MAPPTETETPIRFLICCIRNSENGKIDFGKVAEECDIVSKAAAAKRYERLLKAHSGPPSASPSPVKEGNKTPTKNTKGAKDKSTPKGSAKKRKVDQTEAETGEADDSNDIEGGFDDSVSA